MEGWDDRGASPSTANFISVLNGLLEVYGLCTSTF